LGGTNKPAAGRSLNKLQRREGVLAAQGLAIGIAVVWVFVIAVLAVTIILIGCENAATRWKGAA
jgi:hypothetical protein